MYRKQINSIPFCCTFHNGKHWQPPTSLPLRTAPETPGGSGDCGCLHWVLWTAPLFGICQWPESHHQALNLLTPARIYSIKFHVIHISQIIPVSSTDLWGQSLQIFWSAKDPPMTLDKTGGCPRAFKASSKLSTKLLKNSNASCCSRRLTGSPHNLWRKMTNIVKPDL